MRFKGLCYLPCRVSVYSDAAFITPATCPSRLAGSFGKMGELRRRFLNLDSPSSEVSRTPSPALLPESVDKDSHVRVPLDKINQLNEHIKKAKHPKSSKRRNAWIFGLGSIVGIIVALFFAQTHDVVDLAVLKQLNLDSFLDVLPAGLLKDAQELQVCTFRSSATSR